MQYDKADNIRKALKQFRNELYTPVHDETGRLVTLRHPIGEIQRRDVAEVEQLHNLMRNVVAKNTSLASKLREPQQVGGQRIQEYRDAVNNFKRHLEALAQSPVLNLDGFIDAFTDFKIDLDGLLSSLHMSTNNIVKNEQSTSAFRQMAQRVGYTALGSGALVTAAVLYSANQIDLTQAMATSLISSAFDFVQQSIPLQAFIFASQSALLLSRFLPPREPRRKIKSFIHIPPFRHAILEQTTVPERIVSSKRRATTEATAFLRGIRSQARGQPRQRRDEPSIRRGNHTRLEHLT